MPWMHSEQCSGKGILHIPFTASCNVCFMEIDPHCRTMSIRDYPRHDIFHPQKIQPSQLFSPSHIGLAFSDRPPWKFVIILDSIVVFLQPSPMAFAFALLLTVPGAWRLCCIDFFVPKKKCRARTRERARFGLEYDSFSSTVEQIPKVSQPTYLSCPSNSMTEASFQIYKTFSMRPCLKISILPPYYPQQHASDSCGAICIIGGFVVLLQVELRQGGL